MVSRRRILSLVGVPILGSLGGGAYAAVRRSRNPYYDGPVTANFDGVRFTDGRPVKSGFRELLQWQLEGGRETWPSSYAAAEADRPPARVAGLRIVHLGHASFLIQTGGLNLLVDPVYSERASPFTFYGPKRVNAPGVSFDDLPPIDAVLITHNHYDHMDMATLERIGRRDAPRFVVPLGNDGLIREKLPDARIDVQDWGGQVTLSDAIQVTFLPCYHWSARGALDRRMALWAAFMITTPAGLVYHVGDTGYHDGSYFRQARDAFGAIRLAILPIGAYEPRWFMSEYHMNPEEAVRALQDCGAAQALGHHWGTFQLTNEGIEHPLESLNAARQNAGLAEEHFLPVKAGMVWTV